MTNSVEIQVTAKDNTSAAFKSAESAGLSASKTITTAFSKAGGLIGGELGGVLGSISAGLDQVGEHAVSMGTKLLVGGASAASLGLLLGQIGSTEKAASQQLDTAIEQTGASVSDYSKQLAAAVNKGEDFGHSATDVENALAQLTEATGDTSTALSYMTLVENLAAAKHENLAAAAQTVTMVLGGNTRVLKQYGIDLGSGTHTTQQLTDALNQMSVKLAGQASAASDTFEGHLTSMEQHAQQFIATISNDVAPGLTVLGSGLAIVGAGMDIQAARATKAAAAQTALAAANLAEAGTADDAAVSNVALAASEDKVATSAAGAGSSSLLAKAGIGSLATAAAAGYLEMANLTKEAHGSAAGFLALASPVANISLGTSVLATKLVNLVGIGKQVPGQGKEIGTVLDNVAGKENNAANATNNLTTEMLTQHQTMMNLGAQMRDDVNGLVSKSNATINAAEAQDQFSDSIKNNTYGFGTNSDAMLQALSQINQITTAQENAGVPWSTITKTVKDNEQQLYGVGKQAGDTKGQVDDLIKKYGLVPKEITTTLSVDNQLAIDKLSVQNALIDAAAGRASGTELIIAAQAEANLKGGSYVTGGIVGAATGGVHSGMRLVGEHGPELVNLAPGSNVHSNPDSMRMLSGGGSAQPAAIEVHFTGNTDSGLSQWFQSALRAGQIVIRQQYVTA